MMVDLDIKAYLYENVLCITRTGCFIDFDTMKLRYASDKDINDFMAQPHKEIKIPYDYIFMLNHHRDNMCVVNRVIKEMKMIIDLHKKDQLI
jgi:hypothetical protein